MPLIKANSPQGVNVPYLEQVLLDRPEVFYTFNEPLGSGAIDRSGFGRNGTYQTAGTPQAAGRTGSVVTFSHPLTDQYYDLSAEMVIRVSGQQWGQLCSVGDCNNPYNGFSLHINNGNGTGAGRMLVGAANGVAWLNAGRPEVQVQNGRHHIALSYDSYNKWAWVFLNGYYLWRFGVNPRTAGSYGQVGSSDVSGITIESFALFGCLLSHDRIYAHAKTIQLGL